MFANVIYDKRIKNYNSRFMHLKYLFLFCFLFFSNYFYTLTLRKGCSTHFNILFVTAKDMHIYRICKEYE